MGQRVGRRELKTSNLSTKQSVNWKWTRLYKLNPIPAYLQYTSFSRTIPPKPLQTATATKSQVFEDYGKFLSFKYQTYDQGLFFCLSQHRHLLGILNIDYIAAKFNLIQYSRTNSILSHAFSDLRISDIKFCRKKSDSFVTGNELYWKPN